MLPRKIPQWRTDGVARAESEIQVLRWGEEISRTVGGPVRVATGLLADMFEKKYALLKGNHEGGFGSEDSFLEGMRSELVECNYELSAVVGSIAVTLSEELRGVNESTRKNTYKSVHCRIDYYMNVLVSATDEVRRAVSPEELPGILDRVIFGGGNGGRSGLKEIISDLRSDEGSIIMRETRR